jgi:hypothetical protein
MNNVQKVKGNQNAGGANYSLRDLLSSDFNSSGQRQSVQNQKA